MMTWVLGVCRKSRRAGTRSCMSGTERCWRMNVSWSRMLKTAAWHWARWDVWRPWVNGECSWYSCLPTLVSAPCTLVTCLPAVGATGWSVLTWVSCFSFNSLCACLMSSNHVRSVDLHYTWVLYFSFNTLYACLMSSNHVRGMWICIPHGFHISGLTLCTLVLCLLTNWEICWSVFHMGLCHDAYLFACQSVYLSGELPCFLVWDKLWYYMIKKFLKPDSIIPTMVVSKIGFNDFVPISALVEIF